MIARRKVRRLKTLAEKAALKGHARFFVENECKSPLKRTTMIRSSSKLERSSTVLKRESTLVSELRTKKPPYKFKTGAIYTGQWFHGLRDGKGV